MFCPHCRTENLNDSKYCINCGKNLLTIKNESGYECSDCGKDIPADALYCWNCGMSLEQKEDKKNINTNVGIEPPKSRSLKANKKIVDESICKVCSNPFTLGEDIKLCERCQSIYHYNCWEQNGGCNQDGCREETKSCPFCGKEIKSTALKCKHCGQYIDESLKDRYINRGKLKEASDALTMSIVGIFCFGIILGPMAISKANKAIKKIDNEPGWEGRSSAKAAIIIGWIVVVLWVIGLLSRFAQ